MYGDDITPNQHKLAHQFGVLDNFYDSGDVSGDGHVWSTSASISDYVAKTWPIGYRGREHTYDSEGTYWAASPWKMSFPMPASPPAVISGKISPATESRTGTTGNTSSAVGATRRRAQIRPAPDRPKRPARPASAPPSTKARLLKIMSATRAAVRVRTPGPSQF